MKVNILGIEYKIIFIESNEKLGESGNLEGLCDMFNKEITIKRSNNKKHEDTVLRHEIIIAKGEEVIKFDIL